MNWVGDRVTAFMMGLLFGVVGTVVIWAIVTMPTGGI